MNLENAVTMSQLAEPKPVKTVKEILSSTQVAYKVLARCEAGGYPYKHFPVTKDGAKAWAKKFLTSKEFQLMRINLNAAAAPHNPRDPNRVKYYIKANADEFDPLLVDVNRRKEGRTHLGYIPEVIFVDGKHRRAAMLAQGRTEHWAYVGLKAIKKMPKQLEIKASHDEIYLPPVDKSKIASQYELMCATVPAVSMPPRQDAGSGGSRPHDHLHSNKKTKVKAADCNACGARSTGSLEPAAASDTKIPPNASDSGPKVEVSDQRVFNPNKPQNYPSGAKPGDANTFGSPPLQAPGAGVGPRVINKGASRSEMARTVNAGGPGSGRRSSGETRTTSQMIDDQRKGQTSNERLGYKYPETRTTSQMIDDNKKFNASKKIKSAVKIKKMYTKKKSKGGK